MECNERGREEAEAKTPIPIAAESRGIGVRDSATEWWEWCGVAPPGGMSTRASTGGVTGWGAGGTTCAAVSATSASGQPRSHSTIRMTSVADAGGVSRETVARPSVT